MLDRPIPTAARPSGLRSPTPPRVLLVDDDEHITAALRRQLRGRFNTVSASGGTEALEIAGAAPDPFAAVVSDLRMPGMDGLSFLEAMSSTCPETTRLLLTGYADVDTAIDALNSGHVFRFLTKPCEPSAMAGALDAAVAQHRLVTSERELLQRTLNRSIDALTETLAMANPPAFSRALRIRTVVSEILDALDVEDRWHIEVASMLSQLGAVSLPSSTIESLHRGEALDDAEQAMVMKLPSLALQLIADIPRLDTVRAVLQGLATSELMASDVPFGSGVVRAAIAFDELEASGIGLDASIQALRECGPVQDETVVDALARVRGSGHIGGIAEVHLKELRVGMVLRGDVLTSDGLLLVGRGQTVSESLLARIANFADRVEAFALVEVSYQGPS